MANGHGGYREPQNPAPASGPGALSQRTDGGPVDGQGRMQLPDAKYGEQAEFQEAQAGAPMAQAMPVDLAGLVPFDVESQRPGEPVTAGATMDDGSRRNSAEDLRQARSWISYLKVIASQPDAPSALRQLVRQVESDGAGLSD